MPFYEFQCECGKVIEKLVKMGTDSLECECGKEAKKIMSVPCPPQFDMRSKDRGNQHWTRPPSD